MRGQLALLNELDERQAVRFLRERIADDDVGVHLFEQFDHRVQAVGHFDIVIRGEQLSHEIHDLRIVVDHEHRPAVLVEREFALRDGRQRQPVVRVDRHDVVVHGRVLGGYFQPRQPHGERRLGIGGAFDRDLAVHAGHDAVADRQPQVALERKPPFALALEIIQHAVTVENGLDVVEVDPDAVVRGRYEQFPVVVADRQVHRTVVRCVLECVGQQCVEDRRKSFSVARPCQVALDVQLAVDAVLLGVFAEGLGDSLGDFGHGYQLDVFILIVLRGADAAELVEHVDQVVELRHVLPDGLCVFEDIGVRFTVGNDLLAGPRDHRQRHGQLLCDVREKSHFRFVDLLFAPAFEALQLFGLALPVAEQVIAQGHGDGGQRQQHVEQLCQKCGVPGRFEAYFQ